MKKLYAFLTCAAVTVAAIPWCKNTAPVHADYNETVTFSELDLSVNDGEPIRGVDISSIIAVENSGVVFHDETGSEADIFEILADHGVNYIRVRVWNQPSDSSGNTYGGGNNTVETAAEIGQRAAQYGLKLLVDFHYSDFWADPEKQTVPKTWRNYTADEKGSAIYDYTLESLQTIQNAGANIGMVQIGNETNCFLCGESDMYTVCELLKAGCNAVENFDDSILKVVHFADPSSGNYPWYAQVLDECEVNYDVFATSYYPYWHGTTDNLTSVLKNIADTYDKYVMVAETAYLYTDDDGDKYPNVVSSTSSGCTFRYDISVDGQAACLTDVFQAVANVGAKGIGVFYWEPAWLGVYDNSWEQQLSAWETYGSGWCTAYAAEYDTSVTDVGGSSYDNQALFDFYGYPLDSLNVFSNIYPQAYAYDEADAYTPVSGIYQIQNQNSTYYLSVDAQGNIIQSETPAQWHLIQQSDNTYVLQIDNQWLTISTADDGQSTVRLGSIAESLVLIANKNNTCSFLTSSSELKSCIDVFDSSSYSGAWITYNTYTGIASQQFVLTCISEDEDETTFTTESETTQTEVITTEATTETESCTEQNYLLLGDVLKDDCLDILDIVLFSQYLLGIETFSYEQALQADMNQDGKINVFDLILLKKEVLCVTT